MAKIALIADTHYGVRNDNVNYYEHFSKFFDNIFFPYLKEHKIQKVVHLGDVVDRRKYINFLTAHHLRKSFLEPLEDLGIETDIIVGNHDTYYKNTNEINAIDEVVRRYSNVNFYKDPIEVDLLGIPTLYLPWICNQNRKRSIDLIKTTDAKLCIGHLEIEGFLMQPGQVNKEGINPSMFDKFNKTLSGHFHLRSSNKNIYYLGCPYQMNWSDYGLVKGFHILDSETQDLEFVKNPYDMYTRITIDSPFKAEKYLNKQSIKDHYVKIVIKENIDGIVLDDFVSKVEALSPYEVKIVDETMVHQRETIDIEHLEDTQQIISNYIKSIDTSVDDDKLTDKILDLYHRAMNAE